MAKPYNTYQTFTFFAVRIIFTSDFLEACGPPVAIDWEISSEYILQSEAAHQYTVAPDLHAAASMDASGATCSTPFHKQCSESQHKGPQAHSKRHFTLCSCYLFRSHVA